MMLKKKTTNGQKGVTLVELLISLTIFLVGTAAIYGVVRLATIQRNTVNSRTDQMRSARIALEYLRRDTLNAGFGYHRTGGLIPDNAANGLFGLPVDADTDYDWLTSVMTGNDINTNALSFGVKTDVLVLASRDNTFNNGTVTNGFIAPVYKNATNTGTTVNINADTTITGNDFSNCNINDVYLFEYSGGTTQVLGMVTGKPNNNQIQMAPGDPLGLNQSATASGNNQSLFMTTTGGGTLKRVTLISYSVTNAGVLVRKKYGNVTGGTAAQQIDTRELVYGVSDFQIKYYLEDGTTVDDPSSANDGRTNQKKMDNVVQVQISITLVPSVNDSQVINAPVILKEFISTKNLRYEAS